jgi:hypothetical protein
VLFWDFLRFWTPIFRVFHAFGLAMNHDGLLLPSLLASLLPSFRH